MIDRTSMRALSTILESTSKRPKRGQSSVSVFDVDGGTLDGLLPPLHHHVELDCSRALGIKSTVR